MNTEREWDRNDRDRRVHVRILGVTDTLRWSWEVLTDRLELVGFALLVGLLSVLPSLGISRPGSGTPPTFAGWVWPAYLVFVIATAGVWGLVYATTDDAVGERTRPLGDRIVSVAARLPTLLATAVLTWTISLVGLVFLVVPGVYLFHRLLLSYPACVIDGKGPLESLRASWSAAGGNVPKVFALSLAYIVLVVVSNAVAGRFGPYTLAGGLVSAVLTAVLVPLFGLSFGHLYLETTRNR